MKSGLSAAALLLATGTAASAHPGHDHSTLPAAEFAVHHWITGGLGVLVLGLVAGFASLRIRGARRESAKVEARASTRRD